MRGHAYGSSVGSRDDFFYLFFFKQKTAYEIYQCDWSSDVCSSDLSLGLANWNKPAAACLSSRISRGIPITRIHLSRVEQAEIVLANLGLTQRRVRVHGDVARIEVGPTEIPMVMEQDRRLAIISAFKKIGFQTITLDLEGYRPGGGN